MKTPKKLLWAGFAILVVVLIGALTFLVASWSAGVSPGRAFKIMKVEKGRLFPRKIIPGEPFDPQKLDGRTVEVVGVVEKGATFAGIYACILKGLDNVKIVVFADAKNYLLAKGVPVGHLKNKKVRIIGTFQVHEQYGYEIIVDDMEVLEQNNQGR